MEEIFWPVLLTKATFNSFLKLRAKSFFKSCMVSLFYETEFGLVMGRPAVSRIYKGRIDGDSY